MAVELEHLGYLQKALELFLRVKGMAVDSPAFLCLIDKGIVEIQTKIARRERLHVNRVIKREASQQHIGRAFFDPKFKYL